MADPSGIRTLLRHHLARPAATIAAMTLVITAVLDAGDRLLFSLLALVLGGQMVIDMLLTRVGRPLAPSTTFRVALATWPVMLGALGAAGWTGDQFQGEAIAIAGLIMGGLVAVVEPLSLAGTWAIVSGVALTAGAAYGGPVTSATLMTAAAAGAGVIFGDQLRRVLERALGVRRQLIHEAGQISSREDDPLAVASQLLESLVRWTPLEKASLIWFTSDARAVVLAVAGEELPPIPTAGHELPDDRNVYLRRQAQHGPWVSGRTVQESNGGHSQPVASLGINAHAHVPLLYEGGVLGLLVAGIGERRGHQSAVTEYLPAMSELADAAATRLGPRLAALEQKSSAARAIDDVLDRQSFWPVFQPIIDLNRRCTVGFEALTRFDAAVSTQRLFVQAGLVGRLGDLEEATMRAAVRASSDLPRDCWVSLNSSPELLVDTARLTDILRPMRVPVVIEVSEHEVIADYGPITKAFGQLGTNYRLAVDDAGAGFASLRHILEIKPAFVKLDMGLVQGVAGDPGRRALVAGFVHFAREAGFTLIAEGIEERADLRVLRGLGVGLGQGFLLGRPVRASEMVTVPSRRRRKPHPAQAGL